MIFGDVPVADCAGAILAHSTAVGGRRLKKGHCLTHADAEALQQAGVDTVTVAQLERGDVGEDEAARRVARALVGGRLEAAEAFTGRANIHAKAAGVFCAEVAMVDALNRITPAITLATLADSSAVEAGRMVATVKIIPFAVPERDVAAVEDLLAGMDALQLYGFQTLRVGLLATRLPSLKPSVMDKTRRTLEARLARAGNRLAQEVRCDHTVDALAQEIAALAPEMDVLIIFGASAIVDHGDVIPRAIEQAGGVVDYMGMPVDPGNLLLVGRVGKTRIIGAPGCARSPVENGFDWILHRILAGCAVGGDYISGLGVGGLLMEITSRPQPREGKS